MQMPPQLRFSLLMIVLMSSLLSTVFIKEAWNAVLFFFLLILLYLVSGYFTDFVM